MTFEEAQELFYNNEKVREQFDYWEIDNAIAIVSTFINDCEKIKQELGL